MSSTKLILAGASLAIGCALAQFAQADEVDQLIWGDTDAASSPAEPVIVADASPRIDAANPNQATHDPQLAAAHYSWTTGVVPAMAADGDESSDVPVAADDAAHGKSASPFAISFVPEPSAIALAGAALLYFLVFGRRRQWA